MAHDKLRVTATGAGVAYYPEFVARELGYFEDEGLVVETRAPGHGPWVARDLDTDAADVALGGIWRPLMYRGRLSTYYAFAQLCARCPLYLLSKKRLDDFSWPDLFDKLVLMSDGPPSSTCGGFDCSRTCWRRRRRSSSKRAWAISISRARRRRRS